MVLLGLGQGQASFNDCSVFRDLICCISWKLRQSQTLDIHYYLMIDYPRLYQKHWLLFVDDTIVENSQQKSTLLMKHRIAIFNSLKSMTHQYTFNCKKHAKINSYFCGYDAFNR